MFQKLLRGLKVLWALVVGASGCEYNDFQKHDEDTRAA